MRRYHLIFPLCLGVLGFALLTGLGLWQLQRLAWKDAIITDIERALDAAPVAMPAVPDPDVHQYLAVDVRGSLTGEGVRVLTSRQEAGPGYRVIAVLETEGRRLLADLGFRAESEQVQLVTGEPIRIVGNVHWPDEHDPLFTPDPEGDLWFARDVPVMAAVLGVEPVLVVRRTSEPDVDGVAAWPVDVSGIRNTHLEYAITWFGLAAVWLLMTGFWLHRLRWGRAA